MRDMDSVRAVAGLGVDMIDLIFNPDSSRFVEQAEWSGSKSWSGPDRVGVFLNEMPQTIITRVYHYNLDYIQLNGDETSIECDNLRRTIDPDIKLGIKIIKAVTIEVKEDVDKCKKYEGAVDMFVFNIKHPKNDGNVKLSGWTGLDRYDGNTPFLLSGNIALDDAESINGIRHPMFAGVSVNSEFELSPTIKDVDKLRSFISQIKK